MTINYTHVLINIYLITVFTVCAYTWSTELHKADNYFAAALVLLEGPVSKFMLYNLIICLAILVYRLAISIFYGSVKESETLSMIEKIGYKLFELFYYLYLIRINFGLETFLCLTIIFLSFVFHSLAITRAKFLIHTHVTENMSLNYRLLAQFLVLLFIDYEMVSHTFYWLFSSSNGDQSYILFAYYCISISMTIIEPAICFMIHFYEIYTNVPIENSDIWIVRLNFYINVPRLIIQIMLSSFIAYRFALSFLIIITLIESVAELSRTYKNYRSIIDLIEKMKELKELTENDFKEMHDRVCTICFAQMNTGVLLATCQHAFHKECLRQWIVKNSNHYCPKCKKPFQFQKSDSNELRNNIIKKDLELRNNEQRLNMMRLQDPLGFKEDELKNKFTAKSMASDPHTLVIDGQRAGENVILKRQRKIGKAKSSKASNIGSVPYGLPTEAVYRRTERDMRNRESHLRINDKLISFLKLEPAKQVLFVPEEQN